jgi:hypothetical protein
MVTTINNIEEPPAPNPHQPGNQRFEFEIFVSDINLLPGGGHSCRINQSQANSEYLYLESTSI